MAINTNPTQPATASHDLCSTTLPAVEDKVLKTQHLGREDLLYLVTALPDRPLVYKEWARTEEDQDDALARSKSLLELYFSRSMDASLSELRIPQTSLDLANEGAFSAREALRCLSDHIRTRRFVLAIMDAVRELRNQPERINVVDAGCGPVPILGIAAALSSEKAHVLCIEKNPVSALIARSIIRRHGLGRRCVVTEDDATRFMPREPIDLLVSETMGAALAREPIGSIMKNLVPFLAAERYSSARRYHLESRVFPDSRHRAQKGGYHGG